MSDKPQAKPQATNSNTVQTADQNAPGAAQPPVQGSSPTQSAQPGTQPPQGQSNQQQQPKQSAQPGTQPPQGQSNQQQQPKQPDLSKTPGNQPNGAPASTQPEQDPSVKRAGRVYKIAQTLAGGPRTVTKVDPNTGIATRTQVPLSRGDILTAIAMEALSGSLAGLAQKGPGATGRAAEAGYQQVSEEKEQAQQQQEQQVNADFARHAQAMELNLKTIAQTSQAERMGIENLKDAVASNADLLASYDEQGLVTDSHVSQDQLRAGQANGTYNGLTQIALPDGWTTVNGKPEQTFSIIDNPRAKVPISQEQAQMYAAAGVPEFAPYKDGKTKVPAGATVSGTIIARANQQVGAVNLMKQDFNGVLETLQKSSDEKTRELAKQVPSITDLLNDPQNGPVFRNALLKFQRYVSHSDIHGMDFYQSLQQMAQPSMPNPRNPKQLVQNPDSGFASYIAGAFGNGDPQKGWDLLKTFHEEATPVPIKDRADAESLLANNNPGTKAYRVAQDWIKQDDAAEQKKLREETNAKIAQKRAEAQITADGSSFSDPALEEAAHKGIIGDDGVNDTFLTALKAKDPDEATLIQSIGEGRTILSRYALARKEGQALAKLVTAAYPGFDQNKVEQYDTALKDFAPGGKSGRNLISLNTALTHLQRSYDHVGLLTSTPGLSAIGSWLGVQGAGAYKSDVNALASEIATAYKGGVPDKDEVNRWYDAFTSVNPTTVRNAYSEAASLLMNKVAEMHDRWADSVPSSFVAPVQFITDSAAQSFQHVTGDEVPTDLRQRGKANPAPKPQGTAPHVVPAGAIPGRDANGNIIGYKTPNGQVVRF